MMKRRIHGYQYLFSLCGAALALAAGVLLRPAAAHAQEISETAKVDVYSVTLKVMVPKDSFVGPNAMTIWKGVAVPKRASGLMNCIMVAFIEENGRPLGHARVNISYRKLSPKAGTWRELPVARWWGFVPEGQAVAETAQTTHFGNNVVLLPGRYDARVTVNGRGPAVFRFSLHPRG